MNPVLTAIPAFLMMLSFSSAQEAKDGVYTNETLGIRLVVPKDWTLTVEKDSRYELCKFSAPSGWSKGSLRPWTVLGNDMSTEVANAEMPVRLTYKDFKIDKEEKLQRSPGQWLVRECSGKGFRNKLMRFVCVYVIAGNRSCELQIDCADEDWEVRKEAVRRIAADFELKDLLFEKNAANRWEANAKDSWIEYRETVESGSTKTEQFVRFAVRLQLSRQILFTLAYRNGPDSKPTRETTSNGEDVLGLSGADDAKETARGEEEIDVGARKLKCRRGEFRVTVQRKEAALKIWISDEVPGRIVRLVVKQGDDVRTWTCVGFEKKK